MDKEWLFWIFLNLFNIAFNIYMLEGETEVCTNYPHIIAYICIILGSVGTTLSIIRYVDS